MIVSPGSIEDAPRVAALFRASFDDRLSTVAGIRHRQIERPTGGRAAVLARRGGRRAHRLGVRRPRRVRLGAHDGIREHRRPSGPSPRRSRLRLSGTLVSGHLDAIGARRIVAYSRADAEIGGLRRRPRLQPRERPTRRRPSTRGRFAPPPEPPAGIVHRADGGVRGRPDAGVRGRQGERCRRAGPDPTSRASPTRAGAA